MLYFVKTPNIIKRIFPTLTWDLSSKKKVIYLTFDDGPTPEITPWVLSELHKYNAKATFFCIGKNIINHPDVTESIVDENHTIGNHTHNHLNGWLKTPILYLENIKKAQQIIDLENKKNITSKLFRPPYGKIKNGVAKKLVTKGYKIIMWDVLSGDFDQSITKKECLENVINNSNRGSIVVFHDSVKASKNLKYTLPKVLDYFSKKGFVFEAIQ